VNVRLTAVLCALALSTACSSPPATFALTGASVDSTYWCPGGSTDAPYTLNATIRSRNDTSTQVAIQSASVEMVLAAVKGSWLERVGDRYDAANLVVTPNTVAAHSSATLTVAVPSTCTSAKYGSGSSSSGSYEVTIHLVTSAGSFSITAANRHEILAA